MFERGSLAPGEPSELDRARMKRPPTSVFDRNRSKTLVVLDEAGEVRAIVPNGRGTESAGVIPDAAGYDEVLTRDEIAQLLKVSTKTVSSLVKRQGLPCKKVGKEYRFLKSDVLDWVRNRNPGATSKETD